MSDYWSSSVSEASTQLTEKMLRDLIAKIEKERNVVAEERARRGLSVTEWWRAQPEEVRESEVGVAVFTAASAGVFLHPVTYERLAAAIHELGGTMP